MKKLIFCFVFIAIALLLISNYRVPFRKQHGGPWSVGFGRADQFPSQIPVKSNAMFSLEELRKSDDSTQFLADPFFVKEKDTFYLFFEHKKTGKPNASIGVLISADGNHYHYGGDVLQQKFHLSYPQVFKYRNDFYMIPESKGANAVLLYKAKNFPYGWEIADTLLAGVKYKDPSVYLSDTLNIMVASDDGLNMYLFEADSLFGKWKKHAKRPRVICGSEARAGGRIFADKKGLVLPMQNCSNGYGYGLSLYRLAFKDGDYSVTRTNPYFLKKHTDIKEFNAGMHQLDLQRIGNKYYYTYDGNRLESDAKKWNVKGSLKMNYLDFKNWLSEIMR